MTVREIMCEFRNQGIELRSNGDNLRWRATQAPPCPEMLARLKQYKMEILQELNRPFLTPDGNLVIPFNSHLKYHWWRGGMSVKEIIAELKSNTHFPSRSTDENPMEGTI